MALDVSAYVRSNFLALDLRELLRQPPTALIGVGTAADQALRSLAIHSVFDLALSRVFDTARRIEQAAAGRGEFARYGVVPADSVDSAVLGSTSIDRLSAAPISALVGIGPGNAPALRDALHVEEVRDLALWPPYLNARRIVRRALQPAGETLDPEVPGELVPKAGEFPTERVRYPVYLLTEVAGGKISELEASLPLSLVDVKEPLAQPAFGAILDYSQSWHPLGLSLGHLLYSLPLAPGESTKIAVIDFRRRTASALQEDVSQTESLSNSLVQSRSIAEIVNSVATETQSGESTVTTKNKTSSEAMGGGYLGGPSLGITSMSDQKAQTKGRTRGVFSSKGRREIAASMQQHIAASTHQNAFSARNRHASVVSEAAAEEREQVSTRTVTNYNHMHALTVQYYEVVQIYRTELRLETCQRLLFIPLRAFDFSDERVVLRHRSVLLDAALDPYVRNLLLAAGGGIEASLPLPRDLPLTIDPDLSKKDALKEAKRHARALAIARAKLRARFNIARRRGGLLDFEATGLSSWTFAAGAELIDIGWATDEHTALQTVAVHLESSSVLQVTDNGDSRTSATPNPDLGAPIPVGRIEAIKLEFNESADARFQPLQLRFRLPSGDLFAVPCDCVLPAERTSASLLRLSAPAASAELGSLLQEDALYYSQQIWLNSDPHLLTMQLAKLQYRNKRVIEYIDPIPVTVVGNSLGFVWRDEEDEAWHKWKAEHAHAVPQHDLVPVPTGGVFAEAVLGRFNAAEKIDITRFWNWQDSPIPVQAPDIAAIQTGQREGAETVKPGTLDQPIVNIVNPPGLPDPQGLGAALTALTASNMFRDMSGAAQVTAFGQAALQAASQAAIAAGSQAGANMATAAEFFVETAKLLLPLVGAGVGIPLPPTAATSNITNAAGIIRAGKDMDLGDGQGSGQAPNPLPIDNGGDGAAGSAGSGGSGRSGGAGPRQIEAFQAALGIRPASHVTPGTAGGSSSPQVTTPVPSTPAEAIAQFRSRTGTSLFTLDLDSALARSQYAARLEQLVANPRLLNQRQMNACGMAAFLQIWMRNDLLAAVKYAIDLFEGGRAQIGSLTIAPTQDLLKQNYPDLVRAGSVGVPEAVDWVMMSALRNATQVAGPRFLGTLHEELEGIVLPHEFADWLRATGRYSAIVNKANPALQQQFAVAGTLAPDAARDIAVLMHTRMLTDLDIPGPCRQAALSFGEALAAIAIPNHYVVLETPIELVDSTKVRFSFWCWGDELSDTDPTKSCMPYTIKKTTFEQNFYGAVIRVK